MTVPLTSKSERGAAAYSPGSWHAFKSHPANPWWTVSVGDRIVAELEGGHITAYNDPEHPETVEANAHLIAAAPDMLWKLRELASECSECGGRGEEVVEHAQFGPQVTPCPDCADIRSVIAKAEGRE